MEKHRTGKWFVKKEQNGTVWIKAPDGEYAAWNIAEVSRDAFYEGKEPANTMANAKRIVACVNACEGIDTEILESLPLGFKEHANENEQLKAINAQMLEALKGVVRIADRNTVEFDAARAAIAAATKEQPEPEINGADIENAAKTEKP